MTQLPPHNVQAEEAVLGSLITDPDAVIEVEPLLEPIAFYVGKHRTIYEAILELHHNQTKIDLITLSDAINDDPDVIQFLLDLVVRTPSSSHATTYARIVAEDHKRRQFIASANDIATMANDPEKPVIEIQAVLERTLLDVADDQSANESFSSDLMDLLNETDRRVEIGEDVIGLTTGLKDLDYLTGGFAAGTFIIVAGRPGMGKSGLESCWATHMAKQGKKVLRVNLEMSRIALVRRMAAAEARVPYRNIRSGMFKKDERERFNEAVGMLSQLPVHIQTPGVCTVEHLASQARRLHYRQGLDVIFLDYLQLMEVIGGYGNRVQDVGILSRGLKNIARELNIPVVAASQLSRACEQRRDKRPQLSDLRDSGNIEQDADVVIFIYRDEYYDENTGNPNVAEINVAKNRNEETGTRKFYYDGPQMRFDNLALVPMDDRVQEDEVPF